jgi:antitoxin component HigA of HigAB toxin-antitoxin module
MHSTECIRPPARAIAGGVTGSTQLHQAIEHPVQTSEHGDLVDAFEPEHSPIQAPDPIEAIKFQMEQQGLTPRDLEPMIGRLVP